MRVNVDLSALGMHAMVVEVSPHETIENTVTLISVKNNHIDFDKAVLYFNNQLLGMNKKLSEYKIQDDYTLVLREREHKTGCCFIF